MEGQPAQGWLDRWLAEMAAAQHGVVAWWQLRDAGFSRGAVDSRLARGRLHIVHRGVYAVGHPVLGREGRWMAAVLALGASAVLSHSSAAELWGLLPPRPEIHVTVPTRAGRPRRDGLVVHRSPVVEVARHLGIPVTSVAWTLLDLAASSPPRTVERAVEAAERLRLFDLAEVERVISTSRPGCRALRAAIAAWDDAPTRSELERRFLALCRAHGLPRPLVNSRVAGLEVDFAWPDARVVAETDGHAHHATRHGAERDRAREARPALHGWRTVRFTWRQVTAEPDTVAAVVRAVTAPTAEAA